MLDHTVLQQVIRDRPIAKKTLYCTYVGQKGCIIYQVTVYRGYNTG